MKSSSETNDHYSEMLSAFKTSSASLKLGSQFLELQLQMQTKIDPKLKPPTCAL